MSDRRTIVIERVDIDRMTGTIEELLRGNRVDYLALSEPGRQKAARFLNRDDQLRSAAGELARLRGLCRIGGAELAASEIEIDRYGKPMLHGRDDLHFSISHSGNLALCAFDSSPVGVDVEAVRPIDDDVARLCFTTDELDYRSSAESDQQKQRRFYELWTLKESLLKGLGTGLLVEPVTVGMAPVGEGVNEWLWSRYVRRDELADESLPDRELMKRQDEWRMQTLEIDEAHVAAVAALGVYRTEILCS